MHNKKTYILLFIIFIVLPIHCSNKEYSSLLNKTINYTNKNVITNSVLLQSKRLKSNSFSENYTLLQDSYREILLNKDKSSETIFILNEEGLSTTLTEKKILILSNIIRESFKASDIVILKYLKELGQTYLVFEVDNYTIKFLQENDQEGEELFIELYQLNEIFKPILLTEQGNS